MQEGYDNDAPKSVIGEAEYWDIGGQDNFADNMSQDYEFSELVTLGNDKADTSSKVLIAMALIFFAAVGYVGFHYMETGEILGEDLVAEYLGEGGGLDEAPVPFEAKPKNDVANSADYGSGGSTDENATINGDVVEGNPYWALPNQIVGNKMPMERKWTPEEEEVFRSGMNHQFTWQRYKTILEVKRQRLAGSESILWDAIEEKKFWTRMQAVIGLADFNLEVGIPIVERAMEGTHSQLIERFFKRFIGKDTPGVRYISRQAIKILDDRGRLSILKVLNRSTDELRDLYMVAASQDPSPRIQKWLRQAMVSRSVKMSKFDELLRIVRGSSSASLTGALKTDAADTNGFDEDMAELDDEAMGDVEFYEGDIETESDYDVSDEAVEGEYSEYETSY